ncbi:hypothetical protein HF324_11260 [Chitinophaga oryzae]|uniref:Uncharacterized protein n=1 Tax=Chitinophaga oryzae TaxID=2725414 RepID=A0AAE6ZFN1_9BACT|nr:hypothetical protein [Chitinophaga oryzae]QJB31933.1 hypothetical protein HF329_11585 [Chitinophaga oryzae]QJB38411.1 hypothetical protein HF324_11260 [Chitinophaga oryzae]
MKLELLQGRQALRLFIALLKAFRRPVPDELFILYLFSEDIVGWCRLPGKDAVCREHLPHRRRYPLL